MNWTFQGDLPVLNWALDMSFDLQITTYCDWPFYSILHYTFAQFYRCVLAFMKCKGEPEIV